MRMLSSSFSFGAIAVGTVLVAACVGETTTPVSAAQGDLNGPCFVNGTCNAGLSCGVVKGAATCVPAADASPGDASPGDGGTTDDGGLPVCSSQHTFFPCPGGPPAAACYGDTQSCTGSACSGNHDLQWTCFSPNQCSSLPCCLSATSASLHAGTGCTQRALEMLPGATSGATCRSGAACGAGDTQLCQFNSQCPAGQICSVVKLVSLVDGGAASLNGVVIGACAPP